MSAMYKPNISATGRWASVVAGTTLALVGYQRKNNLLGLAGLGLLARGATGVCPVSMAIGRNTAAKDTRVALSGPRGVKVEAVITIDRPAPDVYSYWRPFENLPQFMAHVQEVVDLGDGRSRWTVKGPLGVKVSWEARILNNIPPQLIAWSTLPNSEVVSAGSVRFTPVGDAATEVRVKLQYEPPAGKIGATLAWLMGEDPQSQIEEDLQRFKQLLEAGATSTPGRARGSSTKRRPKGQGNGQVMTEPLPVN